MDSALTSFTAILTVWKRLSAIGTDFWHRFPRGTRDSSEVAFGIVLACKVLAASYIARIVRCASDGAISPWIQPHMIKSHEDPSSPLISTKKDHSFPPNLFFFKNQE